MESSPLRVESSIADKLSIFVGVSVVPPEKTEEKRKKERTEENMSSLKTKDLLHVYNCM